VSAEEYEALLGFYPLVTDAGDIVPRPEMAVLASLLAHPALEPDTVPGAFFEHRAIRRSNEELGRVLAIARLTDEAAIDAWPAAWEEALKAHFHLRWESLALRAGAGLRALLASDDDMKEAHAACAAGPLASMPITVEQLRATGRRLVQDVIEPLERSAAGWEHSPPG
jgi:hypothetical protein